VYPVVVVDQFFKDNGLPAPGDMALAPLDKIREIFGTDAVLYITLKQYGTRYQLITSFTVVTALARLVDTRTGALLWEGTLAAQQSSGGSGNILVDLVSAVVMQIVGHTTDRAHSVSELANAQFATKERGLLPGPYSPRYGEK
jgi:hypothetical protein